MRIVLLTSDFLPNIGGIAAHVAGLASGLERLGQDVRVVVSMCNNRLVPRVSREQTAGVPVLRVTSPGLPLIQPGLQTRWALRALRPLLRDRHDVLHWHTFNHAVANRLPHTTRVFTNHTSQFLEYVRDPVTMPLASAVVSPADLVVSPSSELTRATIAAGYPEAGTLTIPNGVDTRRFTPKNDGGPVRQALNITEDEIVLLCPRRLEKKNGVVFWVQAIPRILASAKRPLRFLIVGDYHAADEYSDRERVLAAIIATGAKERVVFTGAVPHDQMPGYFAASDIVVLPSLMEATSIAGLEAMASGKPMIGTNVGGIPEILVDGLTGILVPPAQSQTLADAARRLIDDDAKRREMGHAARLRAEREFDWVRIAARTLDAYRLAQTRPR